MYGVNTEPEHRLAQTMKFEYLELRHLWPSHAGRQEYVAETGSDKLELQSADLG